MVNKKIFKNFIILFKDSSQYILNHNFIINNGNILSLDKFFNLIVYKYENNDILKLNFSIKVRSILLFIYLKKKSLIPTIGSNIQNISLFNLQESYFGIIIENFEKISTIYIFKFLSKYYSILFILNYLRKFYTHINLFIQKGIFLKE